MLVLTRRCDEKISFPEVGITVHFIRIQSGHVKIGVDAPRDITIVRDEIADPRLLAAGRQRALPQPVCEEIRSQLQQISEQLQRYRELAEAGLNERAEERFVALQASIRRLDQSELLQSAELAVRPPGGSRGLLT